MSRWALLTDKVVLSAGVKPGAGPESPARPRRILSVCRSAPPTRWLRTSCTCQSAQALGLAICSAERETVLLRMSFTKVFTNSTCCSMLGIVSLRSFFR